MTMPTDPADLLARPGGLAALDRLLAAAVPPDAPGGDAPPDAAPHTRRAMTAGAQAPSHDRDRTMTDTAPPRWDGPPPTDDDAPPDLLAPPPKTSAPTWPPYHRLGPPAPPPFPVDALSPPWAAWVREIAANQQVRPDVAATLSLGVASAAAAHGGDFAVACGSEESPLNLYCVAVEESGANKSGVFRAALAPLLALEHELANDEAAKTRRERQAADLAAATAKVRGYESALEALNKASAAGKPWKGPTAGDLIEHLGDARLERDALPVPSVPRIVASDATPEALAGLLEHNAVICLATSEAHQVFALATGRYGNGPNLEILLNGHVGEKTTVDRRSRPPLILQRPLLALALAAQPVTVARLADFDGDLNERGLLGRIVWSIPATMVGHRTPPTATPLPEDTRDGYHAMIRRMFEALPAYNDFSRPVPMRLDAAASRIYRGFYAETEARIGAGGDLAWCSSMASKMRPHLLRIAALLHLGDGRDPGEPIGEDVAARALEIALYYLAHGQRAFGAMREPEDVAAARKLWGFVRRHAAAVDELDGARAVTLRDLHRAAAGTWATVDELDAPLALLGRHGYLVRVDRPTGRPGRPPSPWIVAAPEALADR